MDETLNVEKIQSTMRPLKPMYPNIEDEGRDFFISDDKMRNPNYAALLYSKGTKGGVGQFDSATKLASWTLEGGLSLKQ